MWFSWHVVSDNILGSATGRTPRGKKKGKHQTKHVLEVLLRFSFGHILERQITSQICNQRGNVIVSVYFTYFEGLI